MTNIFKRAVTRARPFILVAWPLGILLLALSLVLMWEDYETSRAGYLALPTLKVNKDWVTFAVAALPQAGQIVLFYIFARDTGKGWAALLSILFFLADLGTDSWFKSGGAWALMPLAVVESIFIFTLGSEILFTVMAGFVAEAFDDFIINLFILVKRVMDALGEALKVLGMKPDDNEGEDFRPGQQGGKSQTYNSR